MFPSSEIKQQFLLVFLASCFGLVFELQVSVAQVGFEFVVLLLHLPLECWDYRHVPSCLVLIVLIEDGNGHKSLTTAS